MKIRVIRMEKVHDLYELISNDLNIVYINELEEFVLYDNYIFYNMHSDRIRKVRKTLKENGFKGTVKRAPLGYYSVMFTQEEKLYLLLSVPMDLG